ncbi:MAG: glycosyltransferase family 39 protein [Phycisphaerae bacterium]
MTERTANPNLARWGDRGLMLAAVLFGGLAALLAHRSAARLDPLWDEEVDRRIAVALRDAPIAGEVRPLDASQTRLPMYLTAAVYAITGRSDLATARAVSVCVGVATIGLTILLGRQLFGRPAAALAAAMLALSPYFLGYMRIAMTEGDIFVAFGVTLALYAYVRWTERQTPASWLAAAVGLGIAVGAKWHALALVPVFMVDLWLRRAALAPAAVPLPGANRAALIAGAAALVGAVIAALARGRLGPLGWALLSVLWVANIGAALRLPPRALGALSAGLGLLIFAGLSWAVLMPEHVTRPDLIRELLRRTSSWDRDVPGTQFIDRLRLYFGVLLYKSTLPVGVLTLLALLSGAVRSRRNERWRVVWLTIAVWLAGVLALPLQQTFYLVGIFPLLMLLTAAFTINLARRFVRRGPVVGGAAIAGLAFAALGWPAWRNSRAFPDYEMFPYDAIGDRWLAAESRGYRRLIQTPSDGVIELLDWCAGNVPAGSSVVSYLWDEHLIDAWLVRRPAFSLQRRGVTLERASLPPPPVLDGAEFVLLHINNVLGYGAFPPDTPDLERLQREFEPVKTVTRCGGRLAVGWVYARRHAAPDAAHADPHARRAKNREIPLKTR